MTGGDRSRRDMGGDGYRYPRKPKATLPLCTSWLGGVNSNKTCQAACDLFGSTPPTLRDTKGGCRCKSCTTICNMGNCETTWCYTDISYIDPLDTRTTSCASTWDYCVDYNITRARTAAPPITFLNEFKPCRGMAEVTDETPESGGADDTKAGATLPASLPPAVEFSCSCRAVDRYVHPFILYTLRLFIVL